MGILSNALGGQVRDEKPRIPRDLPLFLLSVSPWDLARDGKEILAVPAVHVLIPGYGKVYRIGAGPIITDLEIADIETRNRRLVPEDFAVEAWGKSATGYLAEPYVPSRGDPQYHDIWTRWILVDGTWVPEVDGKGYRKFLLDLAKWLKLNEHHLAALAQRERLIVSHDPVAARRAAGQEG